MNRSKHISKAAISKAWWWRHSGLSSAWAPLRIKEDHGSLLIPMQAFVRQLETKTNLSLRCDNDPKRKGTSEELVSEEEGQGFGTALSGPSFESCGSPVE